ncbi:MAG TPA: tRNA-dihydrouridine synthase [Woeseiaceae bacterium]|nr:tRNA-dihydrouridine synthase [Woeseiaceae bacterium]
MTYSKVHAATTHGYCGKKVCRKLAGSALLKDERRVADILSAVVAAVDVPVTLKTRTGWKPEHRNGVRVARLAEDCGIQALAIHGRTRACRFAGSAEYATIAQIVDAVSIPVIANGDIDGPEKAREVLRLTGAAAVMIGRAAQGRPWIFREVLHYLRHGSRPAPLDAAGLRAIIIDHLQDLHRFYGEERGVRVARKHLSWYSRHLPDGDDYRHQVVRVESAGEQRLLTERFLGSADRAGALAA